MAMKRPRKPVKGQPTPVANIGLGNTATRKQIEAAVLKYLEQKSYSEQSAKFSKEKGTSPSAGTRSTPKPDPVFYKTDKLRSLIGQKTGVVNKSTKASGQVSREHSQNVGISKAYSNAHQARRDANSEANKKRLQKRVTKKY